MSEEIGVIKDFLNDAQLARLAECVREGRGLTLRMDKPDDVEMIKALGAFAGAVLEGEGDD